MFRVQFFDFRGDEYLVGRLLVGLFDKALVYVSRAMRGLPFNGTRFVSSDIVRFVVSSCSDDVVVVSGDFVTDGASYV